MEYLISQELDNGTHLAIVMFSEKEHKWIYSFTYRKGELVNKIKLYIDYSSGEAQGVNLSWEIINSKNLGKRFYLGVDVSDNAKLFLDFEYVKEGDTFLLSKITKGAGTVVFETGEENKALINIIESPFPIPERIECEFGRYEVNFLNNEDGLETIFFPKCYLKK